jgi:ElaA protein
MSRLAWTFDRIDGVTARDVFDFLKLRAEVFCVEQNCVFLDPDDADLVSWHLLGRDSGGALLGYLRIVDAGIKYPEPSIGRVVTASAARGQNLGREVMAEGLQRCSALWPELGIVINAQHRLERFYREFGFESVGAPYIEDGIAHIEMKRQWRALQNTQTRSGT